MGVYVDVITACGIMYSLCGVWCMDLNALQNGDWEDEQVCELNEQVSEWSPGMEKLYIVQIVCTVHGQITFTPSYILGFQV